MIPINVYVKPARIKKTPETATAGVMVGGNGSAFGGFLSSLLGEPEGVWRGPLIAEVIVFAASVPLAAPSVGSELEESTLPAPVADISDFVGKTDGDSGPYASAVVGSSFGAEDGGGWVAELEVVR